VLKDTPTDTVVRQLSRESVRPDDLLIYTSTDIDKLGNYNQQWLAVTKDRLLVLSDGKESEILLSLKMNEVAEFRSQGAVGSGLFQARVNGYYIDVLRYSNRLADKFHKVVKKLDRYLAGEPIVIHPEDEVDARDCPTCGLTLEFPGDVCPRCVNRGAALTRMWKIMVPYRFPVLFMLALLVVGIGLDLVPPQLTRYLVDHVLVGSEEEALRIKSDPDQFRVHLRMLVIVVTVLAGAQMLRMGINILNGRLTNKVGTGITFDIRGRLVDHLQQLSVAYYDRQQVGSLVARVAYDTEALHGFISQLAGGFLFQILMVILVGIMMFSLDVRLALFTLIPAPLVISGSIVFWRYIYPRYYRFWDASSKQAGMLSGMLSGIRVVKAFSQEGRELKRFNSASDRLQRTRRDVDMSVSTFNPIMGLVFQFGGWIVWFIGGRDVLRADITLGELMAFFGYLWMFYSPLGALTQFTNWLTSFVTQAHRIFEILDTPIQISEPKKPVKVKPIQGEIRLENVSFGYNRHIPVLRNVSLEIRPGEMIGVVGQSGSGKTTIVNLIRRFYDVDEGRVTIDGVDVRSISREDLRSAIGVVLQEPFLFRGNIWDNITYGRPEAAVEEVFAASKAANCHDFIMRTAYGYDTWVGERGAGLSGGERQRISIARALLIDPRILILDEATSNVDSESEAAIQAALAEVVRGRTIVFAS
jgi:ATP-binding cassette subfamily B protein